MESSPHGWILILLPLLPLIAAICCYCLRRLPRVAGWLGISSLAASALLAALLYTRIGATGAYFSLPWLQIPLAEKAVDAHAGFASLAVPLAFYAAPMQLLFVLTTAVISIVVLVFALRERQADPRAGIFHATITLFAGSMLLFLVSDTLLLMYLAWELMGVCSYLLIGHAGGKEAWRAARQAFWTTRATDFGLLFAVLILMTKFGWTTLTSLSPENLAHSIARQGLDLAQANPWLAAAVLLALLAAVGKAAQFPLMFWLADAMVAPAPVSALLHAATMVAAGPYLLIRFIGLFKAVEAALLTATLLGGVTLLVGAVLALCAESPKRILAYSTVSHLGLVIMSVGVLAEQAGYFHLLTHAWFKAALFLGVGYLAVVALTPAADATPSSARSQHEPSLNRMAGSARRYPLLLWGILLPASISLMGLWPFAGALGKEQILGALLTRYQVPIPGELTLGQQFPIAAAGWKVGATMLVLSLPLTAAYITRLVGVLGWGTANGSGHIAPPSATSAPNNQSWQPAKVLTAALAIIGSIGMAVFFTTYYATGRGFINEANNWQWIPTATWHGLLVIAISSLFVIGGACWTWYLAIARPQTGSRIAQEGGMAPILAFLRNGMYLREFFNTTIGKTGELIAIIAGLADISVIDWLATRCGMLGRLLAHIARWLDDHLVDGARYWVCEVWWLLKRLHARTMQTGQIQRYMFVVLLGTLALCIIVLKPLSAIFGSIIDKLITEGRL